MLASSVIPSGTVNVLVVAHVAGFVSVAMMLSLAPRPSAMNAVTVAVRLGTVPNSTLTSVSS